MSKFFDEDGDYAEFAEPDFSWKWMERRALVRALPPNFYKERMRVLDIGSGSGRTLQFHRDMGVPEHHLTALEPAVDNQDRLLARFPNATLIPDNVQDVDLTAHGIFDVITAQFALRYLTPDELEQVVQNGADALAKGGRFVVLDAHPTRLSMHDGFDRYFDEGEREVVVPWGGREAYQYKALETYVNAFYKARMCIRLDECRISPTAALEDPGRYQDYVSTYPARFLISATLNRC